MLDTKEITQRLKPTAKAIEQAIHAITRSEAEFDVKSSATEDVLFYTYARTQVLERLSLKLAQVIQRDQVRRNSLQQFFAAAGDNEIVQRAIDTANECVTALLQDDHEARPPIRITDVAAEVLREAGRSLHFSEIARLIVERGVLVGGKDPADTLRAYIQRDPRFQRVIKKGERGFYRLRSEEEMNK